MRPSVPNAPIFDHRSLGGQFFNDLDVDVEPQCRPYSCRYSLGQGIGGHRVARDDLTTERVTVAIPLDHEPERGYPRKAVETKRSKAHSTGSGRPSTVTSPTNSPRRPPTCLSTST